MPLKDLEWLNALKENFGEVFRSLSPKEQAGALRRSYLKEGNRLLKRARDTVNASSLGSKRKAPKKPRTALNTARAPMGDGLYRRVYPKGGGFMVSAKPYRRNTKKGMHRNLYGQLKPVLNFAADGTGERQTGRARRTRGKGHRTGRMPKAFDLRQVEDSEVRAVEANIYTEFERQCMKTLRRKGLA